LCNAILGLIYALNEKLGACVVMYSQLPPELATRAHIVGRTILQKMELYHRFQEQLQSTFTAADKLPLQELVYAEDILIWGQTSIDYTAFLALAAQIMDACDSGWFDVASINLAT